MAGEGTRPKAPDSTHIESTRKVRREEEETTKIQLPPPAEVLAKRGCLVVLSGPRTGEIFAVEEGGDTGFLIGRDPHAHLRLLDEGVSRLHARVELDGGEPVIVDLDSTNGTWVGGERKKRHPLVDGDKVRVGQTTVLRFTYYDPVEEDAQRQLLDAALRDPLTRAFNRRYFLERLGAEVAYSGRHHSPLTLLLIDLDHFKLVNDTWGHLVGDRVLRRVAEVIQGAIRADDVLARYGGEEFVVLARDTAHEGGVRFADRLREAVADTAFEHDGRPLEVRISVGVATMPLPGGAGEGGPGGSSGPGGPTGPTGPTGMVDGPTLLQAADEALYRAKHDGRNRVSD